MKETDEGVGGNYFLPSREECLTNYRKIEHLFTYEDEQTSEETQRETLIQFTVTQGLPTSGAGEPRKTFKEQKLSPDEVVRTLKEDLKQTKSPKQEAYCLKSG